MQSSDHDLMAFLNACDPAAMHSLIQALRSKLSPESKKIAALCPTLESIPPAGTLARSELTKRAVDLLRWYASDGIAYMGRGILGGEGGVHYSKIVRDVARLLNGRLKRKDRIKIPKAASVAELEALIMQVLLGMALQDKSSQEIAQVLEEAGLERDAALAAAQKYGPGLAAIAIPVLTRILGMKVVKAIIERILVEIIARQIGKQAAEQVAKRLFVQVSRRAATRWIPIVGWALVGVDVVLFAASPATRMTLRSVPLIAGFRERERLAVAAEA